MSRQGNRIIIGHRFETIKILWRWNTGYPMDGEIRTDAGWFTRGKQAYHRTGKVYSWHYLPRIYRMGIRWGVNTWVLGTLIGLILNWEATVILSSMALVAVIAGLCLYGIGKFRRFWLHTHTVTPIAEGLGQVAGLAAQEAESRLKLEPGFREIDYGKVGRFRLPGTFTGSGGSKTQVETVIASRLPQDLTFRWHLAEGQGGYVDFLVAPKLPSMARLLDYRTKIEALGPRAYISGVTTSGVHVARFDGPEPHHGYCWGTGVGKSTQLGNILAQLKHNEPGMTATIIDPKEISLSFLKGIPGFEFWDTPSEFEGKIEGMTQENYLQHMPGMWKGIYQTYQLMGQRSAMLAADRTTEFDTHILVLEEANSFALMSKTWWIRNRPRGAPVNPPLWGDWVAPLFWRGRQFGIFIVLVAQSIQERFLGNLNLRPSLGLLSLAKFKPNHYESYIGTTPIPKCQKGQGRALFNDGDTDTWVQCLYGSEAEQRAFALEGLAMREAEYVAL